jgi:hypothetical protein
VIFIPSTLVIDRLELFGEIHLATLAVGVVSVVV